VSAVFAAGSRQIAGKPSSYALRTEADPMLINQPLRETYGYAGRRATALHKLPVIISQAFEQVKNVG
jgi:hypothetical protein